MISVTACDSESLTNAIKKALTEDGLELKKCIGIGTDGASVMMGKHNSVYTRLKSVQPDLILIKCVCHSLHLAASKAVETMPTNLEFLLSETYSWFSRSAKRRLNFERVLYLSVLICNKNKCYTLNSFKIYKLLVGSNPKKFVSPSDTRWLSRYQCICIVLDAWDSLKVHFQQAKESERCYTSAQLFEMYNDPVNKIYICFLHSILKDFTTINQLFQQKCGNPFRLIEDLIEFYQK